MIRGSLNPKFAIAIARAAWSGHAPASTLTKAPEPPAAVRAQRSATRGHAVRALSARRRVRWSGPRFQALRGPALSTAPADYEHLRRPRSRTSARHAAS